jgi:ABC-type Zn2+ transport system substrate-binding protein/surface adhesin
MKATARDPQKDLAALTPEQRKQIEVNRKQNKELFEAMLSEDVKKKLSEKQEKAREKQESRRY